MDKFLSDSSTYNIIVKANGSGLYGLDDGMKILYLKVSFVFYFLDSGVIIRYTFLFSFNNWLSGDKRGYLRISILSRLYFMF